MPQMYQFFFSVTLTNYRQTKTITVIALDGLAPTLSGKPNIIFISLGADQHSAAARIYMALRQAEQFGRTTYVQLMDEEGIGIAYNERVRKSRWCVKKVG